MTYHIICLLHKWIPVDVLAIVKKLCSLLSSIHSSNSPGKLTICCCIPNHQKMSVFNKQQPVSIAHNTICGLAGLSWAILLLQVVLVVAVVLHRFTWAVVLRWLTHMASSQCWLSAGSSDWAANGTLWFFTWASPRDLRFSQHRGWTPSDDGVRCTFPKTLPQKSLLPHYFGQNRSRVSPNSKGG